MAGTIRARTGNGDVVLNIRTGKVVKGDYRNIAVIRNLDVETTAKNLKRTVDQLRAEGCELVYCTFYLNGGARHDGVPFPYKVKK